MEELGYDCRGECLEAEVPGTPGRHYFCQNRNGVRYSHVHVCKIGHEEIRAILAFRDYLRAHPQEAQRYDDLKRHLAQQFAYNNIEYMRGKDALVKELISLALKWWRGTGAIK